MSRRPISIRSKLIALTLMTVLAPIWFVLFLVGTKEIRDIRNDMLQSSAMIASVVADYGAAALAFDSRPAAEQALQVLAENPRFLDATIYDSNGRLFAAYRRDSTTAHAPPVELHETQQRTALEGDRITVVQPIMQGGERYGALLLHTAIAPLVTRVHTYVWDLVWLILGVIAASLALAWALERMVTRRLLRLADVAREVTRREDTQVRAQDRGNDEIGLLAGAFNRMLAEIAHRQKEAREAVRLRDEFLSVASHELRTPVTSLQLAVQSALTIGQENGAPPGFLKHALESAERQTRRLGRLVDALLDVSRIQAGRLELQREATDLAHVTRDVVGLLEADARRAGCQVRLDAEQPVVGNWDRARLDQIVTNLLSNAIKYGAGAPIRISVRGVEGWARLAVRDEGIGLAPSERGRIFERFERAVSSKHYGGLGLGLYIVRRIVDAHGGQIAVESAPGAGAQFIVELPL